MLLGDWNAHHHTWSLDGKSGPGGRVLAEWVLERGAEVHFGVGGTFERRRERDLVQSRIDFPVASPDSGWTDEDCKSTVFYRTAAPIIVYYFPYITCLLYLLFLIKHVRTSG